MNKNPFHPTNSHLDAIGRQHKTDKASTFHDYLNRYCSYFDAVNPRKIVEVGIDGGASIRTWEEAYPRAKIIAVDHNPEAVKLPFGPNVMTLLGDQSNPRLWEQVRAYFADDIDIIVDDGCHTGYGMIMSFQLGWPLIRPGGIYCVEDMHSSYRPEYNRDDCGVISADLKGAAWPAVRFFTRLVSVMNQFGEGQTGNPAAGPSDIGFIHFSRSLVIIGKR